MSKCMSFVPAVLAAALLSCSSDRKWESTELFEPFACSSCNIQIDTIVQFDFSNAPVSPVNGVVVAVDTVRWRYYVGVGRLAGEILVFDSAGQYLRSVGHKGAGPGEFNQVNGLTVDGLGRLWVLDRGNRRISLYGDDLQLQNEFPLEGRAHAIRAVAGGRILIWGQNTSSQYIGYQGRLMDAFGIETYFAESPEVRPTDLIELFPVAEGEGGDFWIADPHEYRLERYAAESRTPAQIIERQPPWFQIQQADSSTVDFIDLQPTIVDIQAADSLLWLVGGIPNPDADLPGAYRRRDGELPPLPRADVERLVSTVVEVVRPSTGEVLHAVHFPGIPPHFMTNSLIYALKEKRNGDATIVISRLRLVPQATS